MVESEIIYPLIYFEIQMSFSWNLFWWNFPGVLSLLFSWWSPSFPKTKITLQVVSSTNKQCHPNLRGWIRYFFNQNPLELALWFKWNRILLSIIHQMTSIIAFTLLALAIVKSEIPPLQGLTTFPLASRCHDTIFSKNAELIFCSVSGEHRVLIIKN